MISAPRVLVVDDEVEFLSVCCRYLAAHGYQTAGATSASKASDRITTFAPHVAVVDIVMPRTDGIEFFRILRASPATVRLPVILMTGLVAPHSLLSSAAAGLNVGPIFVKGDDLHDLVLRVDGTLRAPSKDEALRGAALQGGDVELDLVRREIIRPGKSIALPARRFDLFRALMESPGVVEREELRRHVWPESESPNVVDVNVHRLRCDLREWADLRIDSISGGYVLVLPKKPVGLAP